MWRLKGCSLKTLKKYPKMVDQDGVYYSWPKWAELMQFVGRLQPGHIVLNPYKGVHGTQLKKSNLSGRLCLGELAGTKTAIHTVIWSV